MKYRRNKVKREHSIIHGALAWLEELTQHPEVTDVIPGVIEANRSPERGIVYKYETQTGCKLLLKSNGSIQEAFVVTKNPAWVKAWVEEHFPSSASEAKEPNEREVREESSQGRTKAKAPPQVTGRQTRGEALGLGSAAISRKQQDPKQRGPKRKPRVADPSVKRLAHESASSWAPGRDQWAAGEMDAPSLGEKINPQVRRALRQLQRELGKTKKKR